MNGQVLAQNMSRMFSERMRLGMTRKDTATAAKVSERAIRKYEEGTSYPTKYTYNRLAELFSWEVWE